MANPSFSRHLRWLIVVGALLLVSTPAVPLTAQSIATPVPAAGVGPRLPHQYRAPTTRFAAEHTTAAPAARRDVVLRLSTLAVVLGVVILVLLLV